MTRMCYHAWWVGLLQLKENTNMDVAAISMKAEVDRLEEENLWREAYDYVRPYADTTEDLDLMWRLIRAYYRVGKYLPRDKQESLEVAKKGMEISDRALRIDENHFNVHRWSGIFLSWSSELEGIKSKIEKSFVVKEHFEKAIAINGSDALVKHLLGRWCYEVASVSWITRNLAKAIFATPPVSSYEEALKYFKDAEDTSPEFYSGNWLFLAKTYYQLSNKVEAKKWAEKVLTYKVENPEAREHHEEAKQLHKKL